MSNSEQKAAGMWAIVELMGHVKIAGYLTEEERFGVKMGRVDIPADGDMVTQFFGGASVYRITPVTEAVARAYAEARTVAPVSRWDLPELRAAHEELRELRRQLEGGEVDDESFGPYDDEDVHF